MFGYTFEFLQFYYICGRCFTVQCTNREHLQLELDRKIADMRRYTQFYHFAKY